MKPLRVSLASLSSVVSLVSLVSLAGLASLGAALGCSSASESLDQRACPPGGTALTFESFGKPFFDTWCQRCHASNATTRDGAPGQYTFDTRDQAYRWRERIFARAADDNATMPLGPAGPASDDRRKLGDWLSCGAPP